MSAIREGEQVHIYASELSTRYGQPIMGLGSDNKAKFLRVNADGQLEVDTEINVSIGSAVFDIGDVGILNVADVKINPSTEEKQDDIITSLAGLEATVRVLDDSGIPNEIGFQVGSSLPMPVILTDYNDTTKRVSVSETGRLLVSTEAPPPPIGATTLTQTVYDNVNGTHDTYYVIPTGSSIHLEKTGAGGEQDNTSGPFVEFFYDALGTGSGLEVIDVLFVNGVSIQHDTTYSITGDGTKRIITRRNILSGSTKKIFSKWEGYIE